MRRLLPVLPLLAAMSGGCVSVASQKTVVPPPGLFSDFSAPLAPVSEPVPCSELKSGSATTGVYVWAWPLAGGLDASLVDMTLREAIENGGLSKVYFADYHQNSFLGLATKFTVTAYGE